MKSTLLLALVTLTLSAASVLATSNYEYGDDEYVTIARGTSPDGKYAITAHGRGELGYDKFHIYLTDAMTVRKVGPLEEITGTLDTGADAFCARWSTDSGNVTIVYRVDRHEPLKAVSYRIAKGRAFPLRGPVDATEEQTRYWGEQCSNPRPSERIFGTSKAVH